MSRSYFKEDLIPHRRKTVSVESGAVYEISDQVYGPLKSLERSEIQVNLKTASGWRNPSSYTVTDITASGFRGTMTRASRYKNFPSYDQDIIDSGGLSDLPSPSLAPSTIPWPGVNDIARAEVQALLKVRDQKFNAALAIKEASMTADLIGDRVTSLYRAYRAFKKGDFKTAANVLKIKPKTGKNSANNWLEYQYGWMPLLQDIGGAYDELRRPYRFGEQVIGVKSRVSSVEKKLIVTNYQPFSVESHIEYNNRTQVCLWYKVTNEFLLTASSVGLTNAAEIAWESTPWSFVVDWAIPIGDVLGALTATSGTTFLAGTRTLCVEASQQDVLLGGSFVSSPGGTYEYTLTGTGSATQAKRTFKMNRSLYLGSPIPVPYYKSPVSTGHALNALALLRGLFK